ncbi:Rieske (2Fe-2S) protein [Muricoccus radiodurans]|uniref:Rieske (2Fe-2S) protein n=1 Tax=Muricoccus radiodurans TaxID=2231721 RepID=UPI003CF8FA98
MSVTETRARRTTRVDAGPAEGIVAGRFTMVTAGTRRIGVIRLRNGEVRAIRDRCPHKAADICKGIVGGTWMPSGVGELNYDRHNEIVACPWHGYEYDLDTGAELFWPKGPGLRQYQTETVDGRVYVIVPETRAGRAES